MRPGIEVEKVKVGGPWVWRILHPRTGLVLRRGRAGSKRKANRRADRAADAWVAEYGALQEWGLTEPLTDLVATEEDP